MDWEGDFCELEISAEFPQPPSQTFGLPPILKGVGERFLTHSGDADQIAQSCFGLPSLLKGRYFLSFLCERCCFWENFDGNASGGVDFFSFSGIINGVFYFLKNRLW